MRPFKSIIRNPLCICAILVRKLGSHILPDKMYLRLLYFFEQGKPLHLKNPQKFTEKIQWLKLNDRNSFYTKLVDKIEVKNIVAKLIGDEYIIPTIGVWDSFEDIDFNSLPNEFALKSTNGSGGAVFICRDKRTLNVDLAKRIVSGTFFSNVGVTYREWPYLNIKPRFIAEKVIKDPNKTDIDDFKFYCFNGVPMYCQLIANRRKKETIDFYDINWHHQDFYGLNPSCFPSGITIPKPKNFERMVEIASVLSKGFYFLRVDLYNIEGQILFGELTFYPASGFGTFTPSKWDQILGDLIKLPQ